MVDSPDGRRPDPDELLARVAADEAREHRGRLKIFFGASPGVGKTFAMLTAARQARKQGVDVVVGLVETHGRAETERMTEGLEHLPRREIEHRGRRLTEFDLDAALVRKPAVLLVDELAHTNAPDSRHPKRWQDVAELLAAGIDVWTTVNVQHLETLNDIVGGITGVRVHETLPDLVFDSADEIVLVDLPPDELLVRLKEGRSTSPNRPSARRRISFARATCSRYASSRCDAPRIAWTATCAATAATTSEVRYGAPSRRSSSRSARTPARTRWCAMPRGSPARWMRAGTRSMWKPPRGHDFPMSVAPR